MNCINCSKCRVCDAWCTSTHNINCILHIKFIMNYLCACSTARCPPCVTVSISSNRWKHPRCCLQCALHVQTYVSTLVFVWRSSEEMGAGGQRIEPASSAVFTWEEVQSHCSRNDQWLVIDRKVYKVTEWAKRHPGGFRVIQHYAGEDATVLDASYLSSCWIMHNSLLVFLVCLFWV